MSKYDHDYLVRAYTVARFSKDPSSQNGAILLTTERDSCQGYNHIYTGIPEEYDDREIKYQRIEHAERDAIYEAAEFGFATKGATLYCPWVACRDCARGIIGAGISRVVAHQQRMDLDPRNWGDSINDALGWLVSAGIKLDYYDGPISGANPILVSGRLWSPSSLQFMGDEHVRS